MKKGEIIEKGLEAADRLRHSQRSPMEQQHRVLLRLLKKARHTAFGRYYHFDKILVAEDPLSDFQQAVPIHDYNLIYDQWWHRTLQGEQDVCWPGQVRYFALSSGTSNAASKRIPITPDMFSALRRGAFDLFATFPSFHLSEDVYTRSWLGIGGSSKLAEIDGHFEGYLSGINAKKRPFWARKYYKPGPKIAAVADFNTRTDIIAEQAPEWDVGVLIGIPHWVQLTLERILTRHSLGSIHEIWPHLRLFVSGGTDYRPYKKSIDRLVGRPLTYLNTYMASEGFIGHQTEASSPDLQFLLQHGVFFEFLPFEERYFDDQGNLRGHPPVYTIDQVQPGVDYVLIISTCSGTWRYLLGDTVRITDPAEGHFQISGRTKFYLNLCSEHLTGDNTNEAIHLTEEQLDIAIPEYTIEGIHSGNLSTHHWYIGTDEEIDPDLLKMTLDQHLRQLNDDYNTERNTVLRMEIELAPLKAFYLWQEKRGQVNGQSKIPRVMKGEMLEDWKRCLKSL